MRTLTLARGLALAGIAAASATAAHGGAAALADPSWSIPALAASLAGALALVRMAASARTARRAAGDVLRGSPCVAGHAPLGLSETAAIMVAAQGCAHVALLAAGAPAHAGQPGALALHTALALVGAALVWSADRAVGRALARLCEAVAGAAELLLRLTAAPRPLLLAAPVGRPSLGPPRGRAPPLPA
jgi:hypothetical protein